MKYPSHDNCKTKMIYFKQNEQKAIWMTLNQPLLLIKIDLSV